MHGGRREGVHPVGPTALAIGRVEAGVWGLWRHLQNGPVPDVDERLPGEIAARGVVNDLPELSFGCHQPEFIRNFAHAKWHGARIGDAVFRAYGQREVIKIRLAIAIWPP